MPGPRATGALKVLLLLLGTTAGGCKIGRTPMPTTPPPSVSQPRSLAALAAAYWGARLQADPVEATLLGDRRFDDRLPDLSAEAQEREVLKLEELRRDAERLDASHFSEKDRITAAALLGEIDADLALRSCRTWEWTVDPREGPQVSFLNLATLQTVSTPAQGRALVARWEQMDAYLDQRMEALKKAAETGKLPTRESVTRVVRQLDELLASPTADWVLMAPAKTPHPNWPGDEQEALREGVSRAVERRIRPAFERYRTLLARDILPRARGESKVGILNVPGGDACYQRLIKVHTSLTLSADEIHQIGLAEVGRIRGEMSALGSKLFGTARLEEIQQRLRSDKTLYFGTRDQVEAKAREALARAQASMPRWLGTLPKTPCVVKRVEPYEEKDTFIAYYRQPAGDGSRPGAYYVNTYAPETRPRYEAEVLAFHESIPGHHIQIARAQEMTGIPEFRRHAGVTAFVEGWALYAERLAVEEGLYGGDLDLMGMLSFDAWRACRLVVDTGLHSKGWSRRQAIDYMLANTALAPNNIENEVDRYIGWPGQALAYKLGQREILAIRHEAEAALGPSFDLRSFHDALLANGAVSLAVLRDEMKRWVAGRHAPAAR